MQHLEPVSPGSADDGAEREYRPDLATAPLITEVRRLLSMERRVERLICRYLADLADRIQQGQDNKLMAYADELHAARCFFGLGVRDTRERVRVGRALSAQTREADASDPRRSVVVYECRSCER